MREGNRVGIHKYLQHRSKKGSTCDITCAPIHLFKAHFSHDGTRPKFHNKNSVFLLCKWVKMMEKSFSSKNPNWTLPVAPELLCSLCVCLNSCLWVMNSTSAGFSQRLLSTELSRPTSRYWSCPWDQLRVPGSCSSVNWRKLTLYLWRLILNETALLSFSFP